MGDCSALPLRSQAQSVPGFQWTCMAFVKGRIYRVRSDNIPYYKAIVFTGYQASPLLYPLLKWATERSE